MLQLLIKEYFGNRHPLIFQHFPVKGSEEVTQCLRLRGEKPQNPYPLRLYPLCFVVLVTYQEDQWGACLTKKAFTAANSSH